MAEAKPCSEEPRGATRLVMFLSQHSEKKDKERNERVAAQAVFSVGRLANVEGLRESFKDDSSRRNTPITVTAFQTMATSQTIIESLCLCERACVRVGVCLQLQYVGQGERVDVTVRCVR